MSALPGLTPTVVHQQSKHFEVGFRTDMLQGGFQRKTNFWIISEEKHERDGKTKINRLRGCLSKNLGIMSNFISRIPLAECASASPQLC